jgi:multisite-specific tRNA:(cytosine-C5)-methyltransferase
VLVRNPCGAAARSLYLANDAVKAVIMHNSYERLRLTAAGTKVFAKQEGSGKPTTATATTTAAEGGSGTGIEAQFRVLGEGLPVVLPYVDERAIIEGDMATLRTLVEAYYPLCTSFAEPFKSTIEARRECSRCLMMFDDSLNE